MWRLTLIASLLAGCSSGEPVLVVGTGHDTFQELPAGGSAAVTSGPQGGFHVLLGIRCDACPGTVEVHYGISDADTGESLTFDDLRREVPLRRVDGWGEYLPLIAFLRSTDAAEYTDRAVDVWVELPSENAAVVTPAVLRHDGSAL